MKGLIGIVTFVSSVWGSLAGDGAVAVSGFGVHHPTAGGSVSLPEVNEITARLVGIDMGFPQASSSAELPAGDIFSRPKACAVVTLEGVGKEILSQAPYLSSLFSQDNTLSLRQDSSAWSSSFETTGATALQTQFPSSLFLVSSPSDSLEAEFSSLRETVKSLSKETVEDESPDVLVLKVSSLRLNADKEKVEELDQVLKEILSELDELYKGRVVIQVVLTGTGENKMSRRVLASAQISFQDSVENEAFLLHIWVAVVFIFVLLLLFFCVPWAEELDPILNSGLAKDDIGKKD